MLSLLARDSTIDHLFHQFVVHHDYGLLFKALQHSSIQAGHRFNVEMDLLPFCQHTQVISGASMFDVVLSPLGGVLAPSLSASHDASKKALFQHVSRRLLEYPLLS